MDEIFQRLLSSAERDYPAARLPAMRAVLKQVALDLQVLADYRPDPEDEP